MATDVDAAAGGGGGLGVTGIGDVELGDIGVGTVEVGSFELGSIDPEGKIMDEVAKLAVGPGSVELGIDPEGMIIDTVDEASSDVVVEAQVERIDSPINVSAGNTIKHSVLVR